MKTPRFISTLLVGLLGSLSSFAAPGDLDGTYNTFGFRTIDFGTGYAEAQSLCIPKDGDFLMGMNTNDVRIDIARTLGNGAFDGSWDADGKLTIPTFGDIYTVKVLEQRDLKVCSLINFADATTNRVLLGLHRSDGSLIGFGSDDLVPVREGNGVAAFDMALQRDGKIVIVLWSARPDSETDYQTEVIRLLSNGKFDASFGKNGRKTLRIGKSTFLRTVFIQPDGRILLGGSVNKTASTGSMLMVRLLTNGEPDPAFGNGGIVTTDTSGGFEVLLRIALQRDGKIVASGASEQGGNIGVVVMRYLKSGKLDKRFGTQGMVFDSNANSETAGRAMAVQRDGKIVVGSSKNGAVNRDIVIRRFMPGGTPDETLAPNGSVTLDLGSNEEINDLSIQADGKIAFCGGTGTSALAGRLIGGPHLADARAGKDALVKKGDDFFNFSGVGSTQNVVLRRGESRTLFFAVQNDGPGMQSFVCNATPGSGDFTVQYSAGGADVTNALSQLANYETPPIKRGALSLIKVKVKNVNMAPGSMYTLDFVSTCKLDNSSDLSRLSFTFE